LKLSQNLHNKFLIRTSRYSSYLKAAVFCELECLLCEHEVVDSNPYKGHWWC